MFPACVLLDTGVGSSSLITRGGARHWLQPRPHEAEASARSGLSTYVFSDMRESSLRLGRRHGHETLGRSRLGACALSMRGVLRLCALWVQTSSARPPPRTGPAATACSHSDTNPAPAPISPAPTPVACGAPAVPPLRSPQRKETPPAGRRSARPAPRWSHRACGNPVRRKCNS